MLLSKTDREATDIGMMIDRSIENMPLWLKPKKDAKWNDHLKMFTETGSWEVGSWSKPLNATVATPF